MAFSIRNPQADILARRLAQMDRTSITDAVLTALNEAIESRLRREPSTETARRILEQYGIERTDTMRTPVPQHVWDDLHGDPREV